MKHVLASFLLAAITGPGITFYSNGPQQYLSFEEIVTLEPATLGAKLRDISLHTGSRFSGMETINPNLYKEVVKETIGEGKAVSAALRARKIDLSTCGHRDPQPALACAMGAIRTNADLDARIKLVDEFVADFEAQKKP